MPSDEIQIFCLDVHDLGYGNYLFVSKAISDAFSREVEAGDYETVGALYQRWLSIVLKILKARNSSIND